MGRNECEECGLHVVECGCPEGATMTGRSWGGMISVPLDALREVHAALVECGQDLQCSVDAEYASQMDYPTGRRRHARVHIHANRALHLAQAMQTWDGFNVPTQKEANSDG